jgi:hypothetical protein
MIQAESTGKEILPTSGTYLLTGAISGGVAFEMAKWLIVHFGVKNIILQGHSQRPSKYVGSNTNKKTKRKEKKRKLNEKTNHKLQNDNIGRGGIRNGEVADRSFRREKYHSSRPLSTSF